MRYSNHGDWYYMRCVYITYYIDRHHQKPCSSNHCCRNSNHFHYHRTLSCNTRRYISNPFCTWTMKFIENTINNANGIITINTYILKYVYVCICFEGVYFNLIYMLGVTTLPFLIDRFTLQIQKYGWEQKYCIIKCVLSAVHIERFDSKEHRKLSIDSVLFSLCENAMVARCMSISLVFKMLQIIPKAYILPLLFSAGYKI